MVSIRRAVPFDVEEIQCVHRESIEMVASRYYAPLIIQAWGEPLGKSETIENHRLAILSGTEIAIVAELNGSIVGFGSIVPESSELRAVYVKSTHLRRGIGKNLLSALVEIAREEGLNELTMDASLSAEAFYCNEGFLEIGRKLHVTSSGARMACIEMKKIIAT